MLWEFSGYWNNMSLEPTFNEGHLTLFKPPWAQCIAPGPWHHLRNLKKFILTPWQMVWGETVGAPCWGLHLVLGGVSGQEAVILHAAEKVARNIEFWDSQRTFLRTAFHRSKQGLCLALLILMFWVSSVEGRKKIPELKYRKKKEGNEAGWRLTACLVRCLRYRRSKCCRTA